MVDLYKEKGFSEEEASTILRIMARNKDFFIDHMLVQVWPCTLCLSLISMVGFLVSCFFFFGC